MGWYSLINSATNLFTENYNPQIKKIIDSILKKTVFLSAKSII